MDFYTIKVIFITVAICYVVFNITLVCCFAAEKPKVGKLVRFGGDLLAYSVFGLFCAISLTEEFIWKRKVEKSKHSGTEKVRNWLK